MKIEYWDYLGHEKNVSYYGTQNDWNSTILTKVNLVYDDIESKKRLFVPKNLLHILESIIGFDYDTLTLFNKYYINIIPVESNKIFVCDISIEDFNNLNNENYNIINVENYK